MSNYGYEDGIYLIDIFMTFFDVKVAEKDGEVFTISGSRNVMGKYFASKSKELATGGYRFDEVGGSPNTFSSWL